MAIEKRGGYVMSVVRTTIINDRVSRAVAMKFFTHGKSHHKPPLSEPKQPVKVPDHVMKLMQRLKV